MSRFSKSIYIVILASLLAIGILYAKSPGDSKRSTQKVLVEAMIVQISANTLDKLQIGRNLEPSSKVTVPLASLLYVLADPNAVSVIAKPQIQVFAGRTGKVTAGQKLKYLIKKDDGSFEQKTTNMPVGTTLQAMPIVTKDGDILLDFRFEHFSVAPPKATDPETSLPIGVPVISCHSLNSRLKLKPGEPMIAGGIEKPAAQEFVVVRADILEQPPEVK